MVDTLVESASNVEVIKSNPHNFHNFNLKLNSIAAKENLKIHSNIFKTQILDH